MPGKRVRTQEFIISGDRLVAKIKEIIHGGNIRRITIKATPADQAVLTHHPAIERAAYVGRFGWVTITVTDGETLDLARALVDQAYESLQRKRR